MLATFEKSAWYCMVVRLWCDQSPLSNNPDAVPQWLQIMQRQTWKDKESSYITCTQDKFPHLYACICLATEKDQKMKSYIRFLLFPYNLDFSAIIAAEFGRLSMLSLVIWSTLWKPATFIRISKSASKLFITCLTPSSPLMLSPQTQSLPTKTNFAPRANALNTSAAPRTPESNMI